MCTGGRYDYKQAVHTGMCTLAVLMYYMQAVHTGMCVLAAGMYYKQAVHTYIASLFPLNSKDILSTLTSTILRVYTCTP